MNAIESLNALAEPWSAWMSFALVDGTLLLFLTGLVRPTVRRRASAQFGYLLFLLVLVPQVMPLAFDVPAALAWLSPRYAAGRWIALLQQRADDRDGMPLTQGDDSPREEVAVERRAQAAPSSAAHVDLLPLSPSAGAQPAAPSPELSVRALLMLGWGFTVAALVARFAWVQWRMAKRLHAAQPLDSATLSINLSELRSRLKLRREVPLVTSEILGSPAVWGLWRPRLILPTGLANELPRDQLAWVVLHELAHVRRGDLWLVLAQKLVQIVYFFHPAVWLANRLIDRQRECACDDAALASSGCSGHDCGAALVAVVERVSGMPAVAVLGLFHSQAFLRRRIMRLVEQRSAAPPRLSWTAFVFLGMLAFVLLPRLSATEESGPTETVDAPADPPVEKNRGGATLDVVAPPAKKPADEADARAAAPKAATQPITVAGRALDQEGKPVLGAHIYLASVGQYGKLVAETTTDLNGRYEFRDAALPVQRFPSIGAAEHSVFQVFGQTPNSGFAWHPQRWLFIHAPQKNLQDTTSEPAPDPNERYLPGDKIDLDLTFYPSARIFGQVVDDQGEPLAGVELSVWGCERLSAKRFAWNEAFAAIGYSSLVPAEMRTCTSGNDGRFEFTGLPAECRFRIRVRPKNSPFRDIWAATTDKPQPVDPRSPVVLTGELKLIFPSPLDVPLQVVFGDTEKAAARVKVTGFDQSGTQAMSSTDEQGRCTLRLPPGEYEISLLPVRGTPYFSTPHIHNPVQERFVVGDEPPAQPMVFRLRPVGAVDVTVVDAETGAGIPHVDFWEQLAPGFRWLPAFQSWDPETRLIWAERPRTDENGKLRALLEEGAHHVGVGLDNVPAGYEALESEGQVIDCQIGKPVQLKFTMRKRRA